MTTPVIQAADAGLRRSKRPAADRSRPDGITSCGRSCGSWQRRKKHRKRSCSLPSWRACRYQSPWHGLCFWRARHCSKVRFGRPSIYSVLRWRSRKSLRPPDAEKTAFSAYRGDPVTEGAELGALSFGDRQPEEQGMTFQELANPAELQRPQRSGEGIQERHPESKYNTSTCGAYGRCWTSNRLFRRHSGKSGQESGSCTPQKDVNQITAEPRFPYRGSAVLY